MDWEIFTYGNGDFLRLVFNAIAMMFGSDNYLTAIKISALMGFIGVLVRAAFDRNVLESFRWFIAMLMLCWVVMVPKSTVIITDRVNMADSAVVANVPFGLAATAGFFSALGDHLTEMSETVFSLPNALRYQDSGLLSAHRMFDALSNMNIADARTSANYAEFLATCVIFDGIGQRRFAWEDVLASTDLATFFSTRVAANVARFRYTEASGVDQILPCRSGFADRLLSDVESNDSIDAIMHTGITPLVSRFGNEATAIRQFQADVNAAFNFLLGFSDTVDDMVVQAALVNGLSGGLSRIAQETGATEFNAAMIGNMQTHQMSNQGTLVTLAKDKLPLMHGVFESFLYAVFPLIMLLAIITPAKTSLNYAKLLLWINLWAPLFAILNFAVNWWDRASLSSLAAGGLSAGNMSQIAAYASDAAATAMLIGSVLPVLAWFLVTGAGGLLVGVAGGFMRGSLARAQTSGGQSHRERHSLDTLQAPMTTALHASSAALSAAPQIKRASMGNASSSGAMSAPRSAIDAPVPLAAPANARQHSPGSAMTLNSADNTPSWINGRWLASRDGFGADSGDVSETQNRAEREWAEQRLNDIEAVSKAAGHELASLSSSGPVLRLSSEDSARVPLPALARAEPVPPQRRVLEATPVEPRAIQPPVVLPTPPENVEAAVGELLPRVHFGMMGNADVKRLQQLIGMDEQYQTGNYRELTKTAVEKWLGERGVFGPTYPTQPSSSSLSGFAGSATILGNYLVVDNVNQFLDSQQFTGPFGHQCYAFGTGVGLPLTSQIEAGEKLIPGKIYPHGTLIATFTRNGIGKLVYPSSLNGVSSVRGHLAVIDAEQGGYREDGKSLAVIHQYTGNPGPGRILDRIHRSVLTHDEHSSSTSLVKNLNSYYLVKVK